MDQKVLIVAAIILALLPQILELLKAAKNWSYTFISKIGQGITSNMPISHDTLPTTDDKQDDIVDPAVWVNDLFALQQTLLANDRKEAAGLVGEAIVELVNTTTTTKSGGSRK